MSKEEQHESARQRMDHLTEGADENDVLMSWLKTYHPWSVIQAFQKFISDERMHRIIEVARGRTRSIVPVIDGLVNTGNVSAVMRSAEALGYQEIHVIVRDQVFKQSERASQGAEKWLDIYRWSDPAGCLQHFKEHGYNTVALYLDEEAKPISEIDFTHPTALVFGNEEGGVSQQVLQQVDEKAILPMSGFTESFNVSVAAAITMYHIMEERLRKMGYHADLPIEQQAELMARYCLNSFRGADKMMERLF